VRLTRRAPAHDQKTQTTPQHIDTLIDVHVALRRSAQAQGEWPPPPAATDRDKVIVTCARRRRASSKIRVDFVDRLDRFVLAHSQRIGRRVVVIRLTNCVTPALRSTSQKSLSIS